MSDDNIEEDVLEIVHQLVEQIDNDENEYYNNICENCSIIDSTVKLVKIGTQQTTTDTNDKIYLCEKCSTKRDDDARKVLADLESLANEVEQRLEAIQNTERELDQWRDQQLQKNRDFWDEYRRQVENFSACRIRTLQYEYRMRQLNTQKILRRLKRAKYLSEHIDQLQEQLNQILEPSVFELLCSEQLRQQFTLFLTNNQINSQTSVDDQNLFLENIQQLSYLDNIIVPGDECNIEEDIKEDFY